MLGLQDVADVFLNVFPVGQRGHARGHRKRVDVVRTGRAAQQSDDLFRADRKAQPQRGQPHGFGQRLEHDHVVQGEGRGQNRLPGEIHVRLVHDDQRPRGAAGQVQYRGGVEQRAGRVVGVAEEAQPGAAGQPLAQRRQRKAQIVGIRHLIRPHTVPQRAGGVVAERRGGREKRLPHAAIHLEDGLNRGIDAVEGLDVCGRHLAPRRVRFLQSGVLRVGRVRRGRQSADRLDHPGARTDRVFVEVEAQHGPPAFQRRGVRLQPGDLGLGSNHGNSAPRRPHGE